MLMSGKNILQDVRGCWRFATTIKTSTDPSNH